MPRTVFTLLANNGFTTLDNPEPEAWIQPVVRAGLTHLDYFADHMDPWYRENVILAGPAQAKLHGAGIA